MDTDASRSGGGVTSESERPGTRSLARRGALAAAVAAVANAIVTAAATAAGVAPGFRPLSLPPVLLFSILGATGATVTYRVVSRRVSNPERTFTRLAAAVLLVSFLPDLGLLVGDPAATVPGVVVLMAMHVVVAAVSVALLTGRALR